MSSYTYSWSIVTVRHNSFLNVFGIIGLKVYYWCNGVVKSIVGLIKPSRIGWCIKSWNLFWSLIPIVKDIERSVTQCVFWKVDIYWCAPHRYKTSLKLSISHLFYMSYSVNYLYCSIILAILVLNLIDYFCSVNLVRT